MQRIEIDCQGKQTLILELSPEEVAILDADRQDRKLKEDKEAKKQVKQLLIKSLAELREMKQNKDIFDDTDLSEKQNEIDALKSRLAWDNP